MIKDNITDVKNTVTEAVKRRNDLHPEMSHNDPVLIAVSKTKPVTDIEEAYDSGIRDFGENKVQEIMDKYPVLPKDIRWHMIGHLQTNKVKYIADKVYMIHSVESVKLATEISKRAVAAGRCIPVLIEVNVAEEESKFGLKPSEVSDFCKECSALPGIKVSGLMTVAPYTDDPEENRVYFKQLKQLSVDITNQNIDNISMDFLSMGMTGDYEIAIEEGASFIRVGTGIFGQRNYARQQ
ncbi:MAG: YggS family pyridoxal phosphate-dependent enzyme [Lachnospiraceae bacterium]|nr:YggS family pyridoxal phosphate-dependent enzyme [Lachnospiraceae bacterium]